MQKSSTRTTSTSCGGGHLFHVVLSEQQTQTIPARKLLNLVPEEEGDDTNEVTTNALHVQPISSLLDGPSAVGGQLLRVHHSDRLLPLPL